MRLGDFDALKETIINFCGRCSNNITEYDENNVPNGNCAIWHILNMIDNAPTVEPERPQGKLKEYKPLEPDYNVQCAVENLKMAYWSNETEKYAKTFTDAEEIIVNAICHFDYIVCKRPQGEITEEDIQNAIKAGYENGYSMAQAKYQRPQGEWLLDDTEQFCYCSVCEDTYYPRPLDPSFNFCPHCGADMRGDKES